MEAKNQLPAKWTDELQAKLDKTTEDIIDLEEQIELVQDETKITSYEPAEGTKDMVHLSIVHGRRFNPNTGMEESKPYNQLFTYGEWQLFKKNYKPLGYSILKVLFDPYDEAKEFVVDNK